MTKTILIFLISTFSAFSQEVEVSLHYTINKENFYNIKVDNFQSIDSQSVHNQTEFQVTHKLVENSSDGLLFSWKFSNYQVPDELKGISKEFEKLNEGLEIKYYTTQEGIYKTIENWDEVLDFFTKKLKKLEQDFWGDELTKAQIKSVEKNLLTPEKLSEYLLTEIILFHNFYGAKLTLNKELINSLEIDDQYLSIKLPVLNKSTLSKENQNYKLNIVEFIDQLKADRIINELVKKENLDKISYTNNQNFQYTFNNEFQLINLSYKKFIEINNQTLSKEVLIKKID